MNKDYIKLTNFGNDFANQVASYMVMNGEFEKLKLNVNSYEYRDLVHNAVYYLDRYGYLNNASLTQSINRACEESDININALSQSEIDKIVSDVLKEYRGY